MINKKLNKIKNLLKNKITSNNQVSNENYKYNKLLLYFLVFNVSTFYHINAYVINIWLLKWS